MSDMNTQSNWGDDETPTDASLPEAIGAETVPPEEKLGIDPDLQREVREEILRQQEEELAYQGQSVADDASIAADVRTVSVEPEIKVSKEVSKEEGAHFTPVTIDMTDEYLLSLSQNGDKLYFDDSLEGFKELSRDVLKELSAENRQRYFLAKGEWDYAQSESDMPDLGDLKVSARFMKASARLDANPKKGHHSYWFRTDEVADQLRDGWMVRTRPKGSDGSISSLEKISSRGEDEMVLMDLPLAEWERRHVLKRDAQKRRSEGHSMQVESDIASVDRNAVYSPEKDNRTRFSAPVDSEGKSIQR